jgi:hypothetical protein
MAQGIIMRALNFTDKCTIMIKLNYKIYLEYKKRIAEKIGQKELGKVNVKIMTMAIKNILESEEAIEELKKEINK